MAPGRIDEANAYLAGKPCPKCGYVRTAADTNPAWQCPRCHIAYHKYRPGKEKLTARIIAGGHVLADEARSDRSTFALVAANLAALALALVFGMRLRDLMMVYWIQSVIIGLCFFVRILSLKAFSTDGMRGDPSATPALKYSVAIFFLGHYGGFHMGYGELLFDWIEPGAAREEISIVGLALCGLVFALNHAYSLAHNIRLDREGKPNLTTLMFLPYARVVPMHLTIIFGGVWFGSSMPVLLLFAAFKLAADVVMHQVEHHVLRTGRALISL